MPRLSLCLIARDSSWTLPSCLESISPWVDEMVIVDTGSKDDTAEIASCYGARVFEFPWCDDFSAARNESLRHAVGEWVFWMDSDDTISAENGRKLRALADEAVQNSPTAYVMQVHCPGSPESTDCTVVDHVKMFRNDSRLRFEGRIHEQILPAVRQIDGTIAWTDIYVTHSGADHSNEARCRKQKRDLRLLELELAEKPEHPFVLFNLGMTHADMQEMEQAADYLKRSLLASGSEESHVAKAYALLVGCLMQLDKDEEARRFLLRGRELFPDDAELWFRLGILEQRAKNYDEAIEAYRGALSDGGERRFSSRDRGITGYKARHNMAVVYHEVGRLDQAELQWRLALDEQPAYREGWCSLVDTLLEQRKFTTLEVEIEAALDDEIPQAELTCAKARLAVCRGELGEAIQLLDDAMETKGDSVELLRLKCQLLFDHTTAEDAIEALELLCRRIPDDGAAWHNLGTAYQKAGFLSKAIDCYEKSLSLRPGSALTQLQVENARKALDGAQSLQGIERTRQSRRTMDDRGDALSSSPRSAEAPLA